MYLIYSKYQINMLFNQFQNFFLANVRLLLIFDLPTKSMERLSIAILN